MTDSIACSEMTQCRVDRHLGALGIASDRSMVWVARARLVRRTGWVVATSGAWQARLDDSAARVLRGRIGLSGLDQPLPRSVISDCWALNGFSPSSGTRRWYSPSAVSSQAPVLSAR